MYRLILSILGITLATWMQAQPDSVVTDRILNQLQVFPQEKTYAHTDAMDYAPGDRIWLKVYVVGAMSHEPQSESLYAYAELASAEEEIITTVKLLCRDGIYAGYLDIPVTAPGGRYCLRTYTELSKNNPQYATTQPLYIGGKSKTRNKGRKDKDERAAGNNLLQFSRQGKQIVVTTTLDADSLLLLAHCRALPFAMSEIRSGHPVVLEADSLPQGVVALLLVDGRQEVVAEQTLFSDNGREQCRLTIETDQKEYETRSPILLTLTPQGLHEGELADVSVSVTGTLLPRRHQPSNIVAHLMLASDVEGGIDNPEQYLGHAERADSLLAHRPWNRYDFRRVLQADYALPTFACETTQILSGVVRTLAKERPIAGAKVSLISPQASCCASTVTDDKGCFAFPDMDFADGTQYIIRATKADGNKNVNLWVNEAIRPSFAALPPVTVEPEQIEVVADSLLAFNPDGIVLADVEVSDVRRNSATKGNVFAELADYSIGLRTIEERGVTCLHELLRYLPGVKVEQNKCYIRAQTSIQEQRQAAIAIDGIIIEDKEYDLDNIQMEDVARIDVFKTGTTVIWGSAGGAGVISITTKQGVYGNSSPKEFNQKKVSPLGYQPASTFFSQSGLRKTLYWNPAVRNASFSCYAADAPGRCHVVVEGVTSEGRLIHEECDIEVKEGESRVE